MPRNRTRKLWLRIRGRAPGVSRERFLRTLQAGIDNGDYLYPDNWYVEILWKNKESAPLRRGEWTTEMRRSRQSSPGFDLAVSDYLRSL